VPTFGRCNGRLPSAPTLVSLRFGQRLGKDLPSRESHPAHTVPDSLRVTRDVLVSVFALAVFICHRSKRYHVSRLGDNWLPLPVPGEAFEAARVVPHHLCCTRQDGACYRYTASEQKPHFQSRVVGQPSDRSVQDEVHGNEAECRRSRGCV